MCTGRFFVIPCIVVHIVPWCHISWTELKVRRQYNACLFFFSGRPWGNRWPSWLQQWQDMSCQRDDGQTSCSFCKSTRAVETHRKEKLVQKKGSLQRVNQSKHRFELKFSCSLQKYRFFLIWICDLIFNMLVWKESWYWGSTAYVEVNLFHLLCQSSLRTFIFMNLGSTLHQIASGYCKTILFFLMLQPRNIY